MASHAREFALARPIDNQVVGNPEKPAQEVPVLEFGYILERTEPCFLKDFIGVLAALGHFQDKRIERPLVFFDQGLQCIR